MSVEGNPEFVDSNVLVYAYDSSAKSKQIGAAQLLDRLWENGNGFISEQVLQEFFVQATRPTRPVPLPHDIAAGLIRTWTRFQIQEIDLGLLYAALEIKSAHGLSYWDSAIIAAARALGCGELYSEDMSDGRRIEGVMIVNPFR